ncbi:hypothetical protein [uncultured Enterovirga sp.]|uniref:hypothetical protein n=1 Tax=uncultured Enterovirga sp. TaxID=2026352 RepID=UPI0035CBE496
MLHPISSRHGILAEMRAGETILTLARPALVLGAVLALGACSTAVPVVIEGKGFGAITGRANTTGGYTGELTTDTRRCRGTFTGPIGGNTAPLEISCTDGRSGVGTATLENGALARGDVLLDDGSRLTIRAAGPGFP